MDGEQLRLKVALELTLQYLATESGASIPRQIMEYLGGSDRVDPDKIRRTLAEQQRQQRYR